MCTVGEHVDVDNTCGDSISVGTYNRCMDFFEAKTSEQRCHLRRRQLRRRHLRRRHLIVKKAWALVVGAVRLFPEKAWALVVGAVRLVPVKVWALVVGAVRLFPEKAWALVVGAMHWVRCSPVILYAGQLV